jgi:hypothetical protein
VSWGSQTITTWGNGQDHFAISKAHRCKAVSFAALSREQPLFSASVTPNWLVVALSGTVWSSHAGCIGPSGGLGFGESGAGN